MKETDFKNISSALEDSIDKIEDMYGSRRIPGIPSGFDIIDARLMGWQDTDLIVIGGRPAMGKTSFAIKIARNAAVLGFPVLFRSIEMSRQRIMFRIIADMARVDSQRLRSGNINPEDWSRIHDAAGIINESDSPLFINDKPEETIKYLQNSIVSFHEKYGRCLVVIDNLQYIEGSNSERKDIETGTVTRGLKLIANELCIPIVVTSHLNRKLEERSDKRPQITDLRGSGEIEQDADIIAFLYRDEIYNRDENNPNKGTAEFIIAKNRNGSTGVVPLKFLPQFATFENYRSSP